MYTQEVQLSTRDSNLATLPNMHTRGATLRTGKAIWKDFRICTQEVQLSARERQFGKTSEYAHKRSNSQDRISESARLPNVHTRCPTLNTAKAFSQDFPMCTQEVQLSTRDRQFGKTS
ncbi:hypothetical protein PoB_003928800 [Plakobranchus ocellatus]|uniref:Uncharacterized protein n=1 Tax=Plakobranchus ocellatus TaxID=259542 RepID=A0AAV4B116_9GAST|nr:hypothetical protein PoB_003928800 [Plakobranchus ocellatus]